MLTTNKKHYSLCRTIESKFRKARKKLEGEVCSNIVGLRMYESHFRRITQASIKFAGLTFCRPRMYGLGFVSLKGIEEYLNSVIEEK